jgi:hypothetical protein
MPVQRDGCAWWRWLATPLTGLSRPAILLAAVGLLLVPAAMASAALPDGRAWEMVSPLDKNGGDIRGIDGDAAGGVVQASPGGEGITYVSLASFGSAQSAPIGSQYVSDRHAGEGWKTQDVSLPMSAETYSTTGEGTPYKAFSEDLSSGLMFSGGGGRLASPPFPGAPAGYENYYLNELPSGPPQPLLTKAPNEPAKTFKLEFLSATSDLSHVVVESPAALGLGAVEAEEEPNLYEWERATGLLQPLNFLPNGTPDPTNSLLLGGFGDATDRAISVDGSRVVWTTSSSLYLRENVGQPQSPTGTDGKCTVPTDACTVQMDASQGGAPGSGQGRFLTANSDASKVFFADHERLTGDSTASGGGLGDLYEFEPEASEGHRLKDLTVDEADAGGAEVQGVLGASEDGSYVYFAANGVLGDAAAHGATTGNCEFPNAPAGATCNLYLWHEGETRFIATVASNDESGSGFTALGVAFDWDRNLGLRTARVSRDGSRLLFMSEQSLTGYDNTVSTGSNCGTSPRNGTPLPAQCQEVFLYEASTGRLTCVSCNPSGARPIGPSGIPGGTGFYNEKAMRQPRVLSEGASGNRVFFESDDALVPQDTNGKTDVYEYENGHSYLLSDGTSADGASFVDASENGDDVFFITRAQLVAQDTDQLVDLYDARAPHVPGEAVGFPAPVSPVACEGEGCRPAISSSSALTTFSSATFRGAGIVVPSEEPKAVVKPKQKVKKRAKPKPKKGKRGRKSRASKASRTTRRAGR